MIQYKISLVITLDDKFDPRMRDSNKVADWVYDAIDQNLAVGEDIEDFSIEKIERQPHG
ncbi:MAG: hypothetical protein MN733_01745 [Nitrososphaera sp.]|nr:hypothetical protein [Nitrososphaera sp.]